MIQRFDIRPILKDDIEALHGLYLAAASAPIGLARRPHEISPAYVAGFTTQTLERGVGLVALKKGQIVGSIHALTPSIAQFAHIMTDLTLAVHPDAQGKGLGRALFEAFLSEVRQSKPDIRRVELMCRESNHRALRLYESLGFVIEGRFAERVYDPDTGFEDDLCLGLRLS
jgi:ribosomal protein S18 acetylase RimI-like enzyme